MRIIDFTDVDMYPKRYWFNNKELVIKSLMLEDIEKQKDILISKKIELMLGDAIKVDFKFGHNTEHVYRKENWIDIYVKGVFKVTKIIPRMLTNEIELIVKRKEKMNEPYTCYECKGVTKVEYRLCDNCLKLKGDYFCSECKGKIDFHEYFRNRCQHDTKMGWPCGVTLCKNNDCFEAHCKKEHTR